MTTACWKPTPAWRQAWLRLVPTGSRLSRPITGRSARSCSATEPLRTSMRGSMPLGAMQTMRLSATVSCVSEGCTAGLNAKPTSASCSSSADMICGECSDSTLIA